MDGNKPSALKVRQGLQEFMTQSREMSLEQNLAKNSLMLLMLMLN